MGTSYLEKAWQRWQDVEVKVRMVAQDIPMDSLYASLQVIVSSLIIFYYTLMCQIKVHNLKKCLNLLEI